MKIYGLTGGIASGKSTVSRSLRNAGIPVIDADLLAREVVAPGSEGLEGIRARFGDAVILPDGSLDREALGRIIFSDPEARQALNAIIHPLVQMRSAQEVMRYANEGHSMVFMDIPLLYEARDPAHFAAVVVVYVDPETQVQRLMARNGYGREEALSRINSQLSLDEKRKRADYVIDNRGTPEETEAQLAMLIARLKLEAAESPE